MKTPAFLPIFLSILFCVCGCGTQKQTSGNYIEIGRPDIVEAVRTGRFKIELTEALSEKGVPRDAFDSYVLVDGKHVELKISPSLMRRSLRERIHTDYHDAKMEDFHIRKKRMIFAFRCDGDKDYLEFYLSVSARTDSDMCVVERLSPVNVRFMGRIVPL